MLNLKSINISTANELVNISISSHKHRNKREDHLTIKCEYTLLFKLMSMASEYTISSESNNASPNHKVVHNFIQNQDNQLWQCYPYRIVTSI